MNIKMAEDISLNVFLAEVPQVFNFNNVRDFKEPK